MIFRPIEDSSRNLFAKLCAEQEPQPEQDHVAADDRTTKAVPDGASKHNTKSSTASVKSAATLLQDILHVYAIGSSIVFAIGPTAAPLLLQLVAGERWIQTGAGAVLGTYCYYVPLLAINGVSEAFVAATASTRDLQIQSLWMCAFFATFAASAYYFLSILDLGAKGLVLANSASMVMRIVFNMRYTSEYFARYGVVSCDQVRNACIVY